MPSPRVSSAGGPAYFFALIEAIIAAGIDLGLDQQTAVALTLQTAYRCG